MAIIFEIMAIIHKIIAIIFPGMNGKDGNGDKINPHLFCILLVYSYP